MNKKQKSQLLYLLLAILWGGLIFYLSSIPDLSSGLAAWQDLILRKIAHVTVFLILTYLLVSSLDSNERHYLLFVIVIAITYAFIDELHQTEVLHRSGNARDVLIDSLGVILGIIFYKYRINKKIS